MRNTHQRGIAIAPILFIVAILAALAAAIAAGSGSFNGDTSAISAKAQASAILEYANLLTVAVQRVIGHGCTDTQISFENPMVSGYVNPNAPSDKSCHVFDVNGGGISFLPIKVSELEVGNNGYFEFLTQKFRAVGKTAADSDSTELAAFLPLDSLAICKELNNMVGMAGYMGRDVYKPQRYAGTFPAGGNTLVDNSGTWKDGQMTGCVETAVEWRGSYAPDYAPYFFYTILIVR